MMSLENTVARLLEHQDLLVQFNEAATRQYVVLPILQALGWDYANIESLEVRPEYRVENRKSVDYALVVREVPKVFVECKKWNEPIARHEPQISFYAYSKDVPIAVITNGRVWRFYLSAWRAPSLSERIFCEVDIEDLEEAVLALETYLSKSNIESEEAELNAEIVLEEGEKLDESDSSDDLPAPDAETWTEIVLEEGEKLDESDSSYNLPAPDAEIPNKVETWTDKWVQDSLSQELRAHYESKFPERCSVFYRRVAETWNLIKSEGWKLEARFKQSYCGFYFHGESRAVFRILIQYNPLRFGVDMPKEEAEQLSDLPGCSYVKYEPYNRRALYLVPNRVNELLPVLKRAYENNRRRRG